MFEDSLIESSGNIKTKKSGTVAISGMVHIVLIVVLVLVPLVFTDQIEGAKLTSFLIAPPPPPPAPAPAPVSAMPKTETAARPVPVDPAALIAPLDIPKDIAYIVDPSPATDPGFGVPGGVPLIGVPGGSRVLPGLATAGPPAAGPPPPPPSPPPPPPPPTTVAPKVPVRVGGEVQAGKILVHPSPAYPSLARIAHVEGFVVLQATIAEDGSIKDLRVINETSPLLRTGVVETVKTWKYKPTLLNSEPVEVVTTITINFSLGH